VTHDVEVTVDDDRAVRLEFHEGRAPRVYLVATGEEVTSRCSHVEIGVCPPRRPVALLYRERYRPPRPGVPAMAWTLDAHPIVAIAGAWQRAQAAPATGNR